MYTEIQEGKDDLCFKLDHNESNDRWVKSVSLLRFTLNQKVLHTNRFTNQFIDCYEMQELLKQLSSVGVS